jgi:hypothetical protein
MHPGDSIALAICIAVLLAALAVIARELWRKRGGARAIPPRFRPLAPPHRPAIPVASPPHRFSRTERFSGTPEAGEPFSPDGFVIQGAICRLTGMSVALCTCPDCAASRDAAS